MENSRRVLVFQVGGWGIGLTPLYLETYKLLKIPSAMASEEDWIRTMTKAMEKGNDIWHMERSVSQKI